MMCWSSRARSHQVASRAQCMMRASRQGVQEVVVQSSPCMGNASSDAVPSMAWGVTFASRSAQCVLVCGRVQVGGHGCMGAWQHSQAKAVTAYVLKNAEQFPARQSIDAAVFVREYR